ncbi:hypothetical protein ACFWBR_00930 [Streptomyces sp. NPDC060006]|uniref:hypothetical protein n=1 Tax=unclassified Streptomyces TaxID=2593676 RepID=UPI00367785CC
MSDERCVFPGDDTRPPGRWLDRDAAERLLRGEPVEAADAATRAQADRLAQALGSLGAMPAVTAPTSTELPGEAAALAAFRKARNGMNGEQVSLGPAARTRSSAPFPSPGASSDAGLIHLGRPAPDRRAPSFWGRPVRYGLAAALAAGMIGGVAMAATAGVLAFGGGEPEPGASPTVSVTPERPLPSPPPDGPRDVPRPEGSAGAPADGNTAPRGDSRGDEGTGAEPGSGDGRRENRRAQHWAAIVSACRDDRDGKNLDAERRRSLEDAAHGAEQVKKYCKNLLQNWSRRHSGDWGDPRSGHGDPDRGHSGRGDGHGDDGGGGRGDDDGGGGRGDGDGDGRDRDRGHSGSRTLRGDGARTHRDAAGPTGSVSALPSVPQAPARTPEPHVSALS